MKNTGPKYKPAFKIIPFILLAVLSILVALHAFRMEITHDEAYSFLLMKTDYIKAMLGTANTHWLNSLFMKIFNLVFGNSPGWMRLQSVLAFPFFAWGIIRLSTFLKSPLLGLGFICSILLNPYLLDFFSLARGYGMALTFQVWTVIFLVNALAQDHFIYKKWFLVFCFSTLSIASNFTYLYSVLGIVGLYMYHFLPFSLKRYSLDDKKAKRILIWFFLVIAFTIIELLFIRFYGKDLDYGGDSGLIYSLFGSVWKGSNYFSASSWLIKPLEYISFVLLLLGMAFFILRFFKGGRLNTGLIISAPILSILLLNCLFHLILKTPFLLGRTAIQWLPLGLLVIFLFLSDLANRLAIKRYWYIILTIPLCLAVMIHFIFQFNLNYSFDWRAQAEGMNCIDDLYHIHPTHPAIHKWIAGVFLNYYKVVDKDLVTLSPKIINEDTLKQSSVPYLRSFRKFDYIIVSHPRTLDMLKEAGVPFTIIKKYEFTSDMLVRMDK